LPEKVLNTSKNMPRNFAILCLFLAVAWPSRGRAEAPDIDPADWPMYNHDVGGWRCNAAEKTLSTQNASQLEEKWRFPAKGSPVVVGAIHATPTVVNGYVYFGTAIDPAMYKLRPNGTLAWAHHINTGRVLTAPASTAPPEPGAAAQGSVNLIDGRDGILASALVTEKGVYFGSSKGIFYALDRATGEEMWSVDTLAEGFPGHHPFNCFSASAILADGKIIVGGGAYEHAAPLIVPDYPCCTGRGFVIAFDPTNGEIIWKYDVGEKPEKFAEPVIVEDAKGKHSFEYGPSTSSVWSTPSYDAKSGTIFFGTDVHNSPRQPTKENPRLDTKYSAAVIAVDVKTGAEKWVTQINRGDIYNLTMSGYDPVTTRYKDNSIGDTPKLYSIAINGTATSVVGVGCKNGGFYVLKASDGTVIANTPIYTGRPEYPLSPSPDARMIALPSPLGGIQTGCATDGKTIFTNGIDWLAASAIPPGKPDGGRVVSLSADLSQENWRHERPKVRGPLGECGDPVGSGIAIGGGLAFCMPVVSEQLVVLDIQTGEVLKQIQIGTAWSGPSISRGRVYAGTGSMLFLKKELMGTLYSFGLPGEDEVASMGIGSE